MNVSISRVRWTVKRFSGIIYINFLRRKQGYIKGAAARQPDPLRPRPQFWGAGKEPQPARQVRVSTKQLIWAIREREHGCRGQKIAYFLEKEHQIALPVPKIYEVMAEKYTLRSSLFAVGGEAFLKFAMPHRLQRVPGLRQIPC